ncbi:energy-coupling factor ABC transporter ATP-binding protein [Fervidobacterium sp.]
MDNLKVEIEELSYEYPFSKKKVLNNISLSIFSGESVGIIGRNGSGKSTLCFVLTGLVPSFFGGRRTGRVLIDGVDVLQIPKENLVRKVGLVLQNPFSQISGAKTTVFEEVAFGLENLGIERDEMVERIEKVLKRFNLWEKRTQNPFELSGGQLQRLAIASTIVLEPEILILDEPTSQLDPQGTTEVFEVLSELKKSGMTIIIVEHKFEKLVDYVDKLIFLHEGSLIGYGKPEEIFSMREIDIYNVGEPVYTTLCKNIDVKNAHGNYPVHFNEAVELLKGVFQKDDG